VSTQPDQTALAYDDGPFVAKTFDERVPPSVRKWYGPGDMTFTYPAGQRSYDATGGEGAEHTPYTSASKDSVEMATPISITFDLRTDDSTVLRAFHEKIGIKYEAFYDDTDDTPLSMVSPGWVKMLNFYMGQSLDATVDRILAGYEWRQAYNDTKVKQDIQDEITKALPGLVNSKMNAVNIGGYFQSYAVQVQRPTPTNPELLANIAAAQNEVAKAEAAKAQADAQVKTANAQILLQQAEAKKKAADISAYGSVAEYNKAQAIEKGINPYQPTYIVSGTAPGK
jgi:hypothetical protein